MGFALEVGHVDAFVGLEVVHREVELDVLGPDARAHLDVAKAALLVELALGRVLALLAAVHPSAGDLPPRPLLGTHRVTPFDQEDAVVSVQQDRTRRWAAKASE